KDENCSVLRGRGNKRVVQILQEPSLLLSWPFYESTGYILPNKVLLEIAKQMPLTTGKLHLVLKLKHQYIELASCKMLLLLKLLRSN
ncbi:unnamed protein product, partial [Linum tenue]